MLRTVMASLALAGGMILTPAGSLVDRSFDPGTGAGGGIVEQALPLIHGKILICGNFTSFNGRDRAYVARLNGDGSVDESFHAFPGYWVRNMSVQSDGKIVIGGYFTTVEGISRNLVARLNADGSLDPSFNPGLGAEDIIAGGIDGNKTPFVFWTAIQPDGKILITGNFLNYNGDWSPGLVRLNPDGSRDTTFNVGNGLNSWGRHMQVLPNGQILVAGWFTQYRNQGFNRLVRINPDGSADTGFNPFFGDKTAIYSTALTAGGQYIVTGHSLNEEGLFHREMERLNPDGTVDESFVGFTNDKTESVLIQPDGKVIVGGNFDSVNGVRQQRLARFNPDGSLDTGFSANVDNYIWSCTLQGDGKLLIAGGFYSVDGISRVGVARIETGLSGNETPPEDVAPVLSVSGATPSSVTLSWTDSSTIRTGYDVEQQQSGGSFARIAQLGSQTRSYTVTGLQAGTAYIFRLKGYASAGGNFYSNNAAGTTTASSVGGSSGVTFVGADAATQGSWKAAYGAEGYTVMADQAALPGYVSLTPGGNSEWTWQGSTQDRRAVERSTGSDRLAACWYSSSTFSLDLRFHDTAKHRTAVYCLDWDRLGRVQEVKVTDADTGAILDSRPLSGFGGGVYLVWDLSGHVKITFTPEGLNAVVSGVFFGGPEGGGTPTVETVSAPSISPAGGSFSSPQQVTLATTTSGAEIRYTLNGSEPTASSTLYTGPFTVSSSGTVKAKGFKSGYNSSATATAAFTITVSGGSGANKFKFVGVDTGTQGNWKGIYGKEGYHIIGAGANDPAYATVAASGNQSWTWNQSTADLRALQTPDGTGRTAGCWYVDGSFTINVNISDGATHRLAVYLCDWDTSNRSETVELLDGGTGAVLQQLTVSDFHGGKYLIWDLNGNFTLRLTKISGYNAVVNGLLLGPAPYQL